MIERFIEGNFTKEDFELMKEITLDAIVREEDQTKKNTLNDFLFRIFLNEARVEIEGRKE